MNNGKSTANLLAEQPGRSLLDRANARIPFLGVFLTLLAGTLFITGKLFIKLTPTVHPGCFILVRASVAASIYLGLSLRSGASIGLASNRQRFYVLIRSFFGYLVQLLSMVALVFISLGDSISIMLSAPVYTAVFARIFLKERLRPLSVLFVLLSLVGVVLVAQPPFLYSANEKYDLLKLLGALLSLGGALSFAMNCVMTRKVKAVDSTVLVFWFGFSCWLYTLILLPYLKLMTGDATIKFPDQLSEWKNIIIFSLVGSMADFSLTLALQVESATLVSMARGFDIVVAFSFDALFVRADPIQLSSLLGAGIIMACILVNATLKYRQEKQAERQLTLARLRAEKELDILAKTPVDLPPHYEPDV